VDLLETFRPVGDQQHGALARGGEDVVHELAGGRVVEVRGGLVEDQDGGAREQRARHGEALPLPARQLRAGLAGEGLEAVG
jgi:hypothetical protein